MASTPVLDLDTLIDRPTVKIGARVYRLYTIDLLPPLDNYKVRKLIRRGDELSLKDDLTKTEEKELGSILDDVVRLVLDAPDAIHKKLTDRQRVEIFQTFHVPSLEAMRKALAAAFDLMPGPVAATPTGATSPPDSPASTQP